MPFLVVFYTEGAFTNSKILNLEKLRDRKIKKITGPKPILVQTKFQKIMITKTLFDDAMKMKLESLQQTSLYSILY